MLPSRGVLHNLGHDNSVSAIRGKTGLHSHKRAILDLGCLIPTGPVYATWISEGAPSAGIFANDEPTSNQEDAISVVQARIVDNGIDGNTLMHRGDCVGICGQSTTTTATTTTELSR